MNEQDERMKLLIALQPWFRAAMGEDWLSGDWGFRKEWGLVCYQEGIGSMEGFIRLPLPIDPRNPERGLWGMVDWSIYDYTSGLDSTMAIWDKTRLPGPGQFSIAKPPELALLKALAHQEGVEAKS